MGSINDLEGFSPAEAAMVRAAEAALQSVRYDTGPFQVLIRVDMPPGYRGMSLNDGAALGMEAFSSQAMINHVLEEELLHLQQKAREPGQEFMPGTARALEEEVHEQRRFPFPGDRTASQPGAAFPSAGEGGRPATPGAGE